MKIRLLSPVASLIAAALVLSCPALRADNAKGTPVQEEESGEKPEGDKPGGKEDEEEPAEPDAESEGDELSAEEVEERMKEMREMQKAQLEKMMKVFNSLEGEWVGEEELKHTDKRFKDKKWKDEWAGKFTFGGRYFEMDGRTQGDEPSSYRWVCTWDTDLQAYRAWYFGDNATNEYRGKLSDDGRNVVWQVKSESGSVSEFTMKPDGHRVTCSGTDRGADGKIWSRQSSRYTRKRISL